MKTTRAAVAADPVVNDQVPVVDVDLDAVAVGDGDAALGGAGRLRVHSELTFPRVEPPGRWRGRGGDFVGVTLNSSLIVGCCRVRCSVRAPP